MFQENDKLTIVSLFSGAGGLDFAACSTRRVGKLFSSDSNPVFLQTVAQNLPGHFPDIEHRSVIVDARELEGATIKQILGTEKIDLVMGGPPCDDFTTFGRKHGSKGKKAPLIMEFARIVSEINPSAFLFENVPNLSRQFKCFFDEFLRGFPMEYGVISWKILAAKDFGVPTQRERLFAVGLKTISQKAAFRFPRPTHGIVTKQNGLFEEDAGLEPLKTIRGVLEDLPDVTELGAVEYFNHTERRHRPKTVDHFKTIPQGVAVKKSYRYRAPWDGLCRSLTAGLDDSAKAYIHPLYHREMTVREYARIHGFPDTWAFAGKLDNGLKQVANAVPIPMGRAVLNSVIQAITGGKADG